MALNKEGATPPTRRAVQGRDWVEGAEKYMGVYTRAGAARQGSRPSLGLIEVQRRTKLHVAIRNVRMALDHPSITNRTALRDRVAPLVARAVCEIAVLDRETDATDPSVINTYANLISVALGLEDEAWEAIALWQAGAGDHLAEFDRRWTEHKLRAERHSESRYHHCKIADLEKISATLGLTRPRIREVFVDEPCVLPPTKMRTSRFTPEEAAEIRALAKRTGYTCEWIGDMVLSLSPEAFSEAILARELQRLPDAVLDRHRTLPHMDDQQLSRSVRKPRWRAPSKPGPKPRADTLWRQIEVVAGLRRRSPKTIERWMYNLRASGAELAPYETPESAVAVRDNSCRNEEQFVPSANPLFATEISPDSGVVRCAINGVEITDPWLLQIAQMPWYEGRRKTYAHLYADWDLIVRWHIATYGFEPSRKMMHKWAERGVLAGFAETARQWERELEIQANDAAKADHTTTIHYGARDDDHAARPVRGPDHAGDFADLAPYFEPEGADADART